MLKCSARASQGFVLSTSDTTASLSSDCVDVCQVSLLAWFNFATTMSSHCPRKEQPSVRHLSHQVHMSYENLRQHLHDETRPSATMESHMNSILNFISRTYVLSVHLGFSLMKKMTSQGHGDSSSGAKPHLRAKTRAVLYHANIQSELRQMLKNGYLRTSIQSSCAILNTHRINIFLALPNNSVCAIIVRSVKQSESYGV